MYLDIDGEYGIDASCLSARFYHYDEAFGEGDALIYGGYHQILQHFLPPQSNEAQSDVWDLQVSTIVNKIEYGDQRVRITTEEGRVIEGDIVVVTVPLGVLKQSINGKNDFLL